MAFAHGPSSKTRRPPQIHVPPPGAPGIPQPPHTAGSRLPGLRTKIDRAQIPSVIEPIELDREEWASGKVWTSQPDNRPPLASTDYSAIDQGNSTPRFVRVSTWNLPHSSKIADNCRVPMAAIIHPFAEPEPCFTPEGVNANEVPVVRTGDVGPMRCLTCRAYVNPGVIWLDGGARWKCNLCRSLTNVAPEHFSNLDANGFRLDQFQRPEFFRGTIDYVVPSDYWASNVPKKVTMPYISIEGYPEGPKTPLPMNYVFAFDVSNEAIHSGFLAAACENLRTVLYGRGDEVQPCFPPASEIAILTFDSTLHYYDLSSNAVSMLLVPDLDEVFLPLRTGLFVNPQERRATIETLLMGLPARYSQNLTIEAAMGSAIRGSLAALAGRGGHLVLYQSTMPTKGAGALSGSRNEQQVRETDKEKELYIPRNDTWLTIADECASEGLGVTMFLGHSKFIDIGSIGVVATMTGGDIYFHPRFEPEKHGALMESELQRLVTRKSGYNCVMRVRTSTGIRITNLLGTFSRSTPEEMTFGVYDADKAIGMLMERSSTGSPRDYAHIQSALLYTSVEGERRVRVCNLSLPVVELAGSVFQYSDQDALVAYMAKDAAQRIMHDKMSFIREETTETCTGLLLGYREQCSAASAPSQLILPDAFRTLPVYGLAILKSKVLKPNTVAPDVRSYYSHRFLSMSVRSLKHHLYPRFIALHDLEDSACFPDPETGKLAIPSAMRCTHIDMTANGVYLIDNEEAQILWLGSVTSPQLLSDLFGVEDVHSINTQMPELPILDTLFSQQVRNLVSHRQEERGGRKLRFSVVRQNLDGMEIDFSDMLVEDENNHSLDYSSHLTLVHKQITNMLGGSVPMSANAMRSPW